MSTVTLTDNTMRVEINEPLFCRHEARSSLRQEFAEFFSLAKPRMGMAFGESPDVSVGDLVGRKRVESKDGDRGEDRAVRVCVYSGEKERR